MPLREISLSDCWSIGNPRQFDRREIRIRSSSSHASTATVEASGQISLGPVTLILLHGFLARPAKTIDVWGGFIENLGRYSCNGADVRVNLVTWPACRSPHQWATAVRIGGECARLIAQQLASALRASSKVDPIIIVGHSLGCRLVLGALQDASVQDALADRVRAGHVHVVLMAAAVATVDVGRDFAHAVGRFPRNCVIYSPRDSVLSVVFHAAEWARRRERVRAVGLSGEPRGLWQRRIERVEHSRLGFEHHFGHWKSKRAASEICQFSGLSRERHLAGSWWSPWRVVDFL